MTSKIKKIKITFPFNRPVISNQLPLEKRFLDDFQFHINPGNDSASEAYDYWVVYEDLGKPIEHTILKKGKNSIFITGEPPSVKRYPAAFLKQFDLIITSHGDIKHHNVYSFQQALPWTVNKNYDELICIESIPKSKFMSIITSNKTLTDGHKKRLDFALRLKELYPGHIDLFGRGINDFDDKWDVLAPYKYHICLENSSVKNYFTEKIIDSFLSLTFPLYYGCINIEEYFNEQSFLKLNIGRMDECKRAIDTLLNDQSHYDRSLPFLNIAKKACLEQYNLFPFIKSVIEEQFGSANEKRDDNYMKKTAIKAPLDILKYYLKKI